MSLEACINEIKAAASQDLSTEEIVELWEEIRKRARDRATLEQGEDIEAATQRAAEEYAAEVAEAALVEKRNSAINLRRTLEILDFVRTQFPDEPWLGLEAVLVGINRGVLGGRYSAASAQRRYRQKYLAGFVADMERTGHFKLFTSGTLDRQITSALWALNQKKPAPVNASEPAVAIAKVIMKWQEESRVDANRAGALIGRLENFVVSQSHDQFKVKRAGFEAWRDAILPRLDAQRTFGDADPEQFLRDAWNGIATGVHLQFQPESPSGFKGPRNLAAAVSAHRKLHFKGPNEWFEYNQQFGTRSLNESVILGMEWRAQNTGLMEKLGPNPQFVMERVYRELLEQREVRQDFSSITDEVEVRAVNEQTGATTRVTMPANKAIEMQDQRLRTLEMIKRCL